MRPRPCLIPTLVLLATACGAPAPAPVGPTPPPGPEPAGTNTGAPGVDGWTGPTAELAALREPTGAAPADAAVDAPALAGAVIDELREVTWPSDDAPDDADGGNAWGLAGHTAAGWFVSPRLGTQANRTGCEVVSAQPSGPRVAIVYRCGVGRFDWASRSFLLLCGVDGTGRVGCGRADLSAEVNVHQGGKEDGTDVVTHRRSCTFSVADDVVTLAAQAPVVDLADGAKHELALEPCGEPLHVELSGPYSPGARGPAPLFGRDGAWRGGAGARP